MKSISVLSLLLLSANVLAETTYAEKLGWPAGSRVLILHVDDAGMSAESNAGAIQATSEGVANSISVMMPTPWVPEMVAYITANPELDAGLHLTLNAEWQDYRWGPLAGKPAVGSLVDSEGAFWDSVEDVVAHATAADVRTEIEAQLERARTMGFEPTHLDSHMGALFAKPEFLAEYIAMGIEQQIPVMYPGGHNFYARALYGERAEQEAIATGERLWASGLPVIDDLHAASYGWGKDEKVARYVAAIEGLMPGVTMMIMHCSEPTTTFDKISDSGPSWFGDLEAVLSPELKATLEAENIILATWRELMTRRAALQ